MNKKHAILVLIIILVSGIAYGVVYFKNTPKDSLNSEIQNEVDKIDLNGNNLEAQTISTNELSSPSTVEKPANVDQEKNIRSSFEIYKKAILENNGVLAAKYINKATVDYYAGILSAVKYANKDAIEKKDLIDQMMILAIRQRIDHPSIIALKDGEGTIALAINKGMIGKQSVSSAIINLVTVEGNTAYLEIKDEAGKVSPQRFILKYEGNMWKVDLVSLLPAANLLFTKFQTAAGVSSEEYVLNIIGALSGTPPSADIWDPLL